MLIATKGCQHSQVRFRLANASTSCTTFDRAINGLLFADSSVSKIIIVSLKIESGSGLPLSFVAISDFNRFAKRFARYIDIV